MTAMSQGLRLRLRNLLWHPPLLLRLVAALVGLALLGPALELRQPPGTYTVQWRMATTASGPAQLFIDDGSGYSPQRVHDVAVVADGAMHTLRVEIVGGSPRRLRIDPVSTPGPVEIAWIQVDGRDRVLRLEGQALASRVSLLNQLVPVAGGGGSLRLASTGSDPYLDFAVDGLIDGGRQAMRLATSALAAFLSLAIGAWLLAIHRARLSAGMARLPPIARAAAFVLCTVAIAGGLLWASGVGCGRLACSPRGWGYGAQLFAASGGFTVLGIVTLALLRIERRPSLFVAMLVGQVAMVAYIYVRSLLTQILPALPMTRYELLALVALAVGLAWRRGLLHFAVQGRVGWLAVQAGLLALVCVVLADRELPRLAMLSSDPDTHAFLAKQLERFGGIYRDQGGWGSESMTYPAGSASLIFAWASLSLLDFRNALAALPLMLALLAALAVSEPFATRSGRLAGALAMAAALGVTAAALAFPLYQNFSHMEGTGRLLSIGMTALACWLLARALATPAPGAAFGDAVLLALVVFCLASLNPANVAALAILVIAVAIARGAPGPRSLLLLASLPVGLLLLLLDPYYYGMATGADVPQKVTLMPDLVPLSRDQLLEGWSAALGGGWISRLRVVLQIMPWHSLPTFGVLAIAFALPLAVARPPAGHDDESSLLGRWLVVGLLWMIGALLGTALLEPFARDPRVFLLTQYFPMVLAQHKALALAALAGLAVVAGCRARGAVGGLAVVVAAFGLATMTVRPVQPMATAPNREYCGTMGCIEPSDVAVVSALERLVAEGRIPRVGGELPRVLVPNQEVQAGFETWMFPLGGSRFLAMADALPVAFFYHQGDADFSSRNYQAHICQTLDREWLWRENIRYVFLPAGRPRSCPGVSDALTRSERVVLKTGDSWLLELSPPPAP